MPYKLSPSSLKLLKECPRCFWLNFNKKIRRPPTPFPSLPAGMDTILKAHFDSYRDKGKLPPELAEEISEKGIKLFDDTEQLNTWRNNRKGIQWTDSKGNVFLGAVDDMLQKGKKLIVLDFKTRGYPLKEDTTEMYKDQLDIYNLLLQKNSIKTENYGYLLFYYPNKVDKKGDVVFNTELVKMPVSLKNAEEILKRAVKVLEGRMPKASETCGFCAWLEKVK